MPWWLAPRACQFLFGWIYCAGSIAILALAAIGPYVNTDGKSRSIKGWYYTVITVGFLALSVVYYFVFFASPTTTGVHLAGVNLKRQEHGVDDNTNLMRQCDMCITYDEGVAHRHAIYGYRHYIDLNFRPNKKGRSFLYWVFGGPKERHQPNLDIGEYVVKAKKNTSGVVQAVWAPVRGIIPSLRSSGGS